MPKSKKLNRATLAQDQQRRTENLGWLLGFASGMFNQMVIRLVRENGFDDFKPSFSTVTRHMNSQGSRQTDIAERANVSKQAIHQIVQEMVAVGYIEIVPDKNDKRAKLVRYTAKGNRLFSRILKSANEVEKSYGRVIGDRRLLALRKTLKALMKELVPSELANERGWNEQKL